MVSYAFISGDIMSLTDRDIQAIQHFREGVTSGRHWYIALLEAINLWQSPEEDYDGRHYQYLIAGEAFDWLLLAERLTSEVAGLIPEDELTNLLLFDRPPLEITRQEFRRLIGATKYQAYLNFLYGILVEESLVMAVIEEIRKERRAQGIGDDDGVAEAAYRRIYGASQKELLDQFRREKSYPRLKSTSLSELKEFTYWLFKYRIRRCDQSRVASDTRKALTRLHRLWHQKNSPLEDKGFS
ncbi:MAG: hypothetical protein N3E40_00640 [Dehalococcoidia bacterium]|nr:hypothetical protein [Dehalococcoidia bacterium]